MPVLQEKHDRNKNDAIFYFLLNVTLSLGSLRVDF